MLYFDFEVGNQSYKLRLTTRSIMELERRIGKNPMMIFGMDGGTIPTVTEMVAILHASLQHFHHGITLENTYNIFESYIEDGHIVTDFIAVIMEIYKVSGIVSNHSNTEVSEPKN